MPEKSIAMRSNLPSPFTSATSTTQALVNEHKEGEVGNFVCVQDVWADARDGSSRAKTTRVAGRAPRPARPEEAAPGSSGAEGNCGHARSIIGA